MVADRRPDQLLAARPVRVLEAQVLAPQGDRILSRLVPAQGSELAMGYAYDGARAGPRTAAHR